ncbi:MAG: flagellar basal-body MS-ring/collar protein FliF [Candidatus Sedimenticola sp. (ex Thyasira tokunagai)]
MDVANSENGMSGQMARSPLGRNVALRQLIVMVGMAASVALGVAVVLWSQTPNYSLLYANLSQKDAANVVAALEQNNIGFEIDQATGALMVESGKVHDARMKLAGQGLPQSDSLGFELLQQESGFGTSRALEAARFHRALEGELARTIGTLANIASARVHLATPKQSAFARKRKAPSASVVIKLYSGRLLDKGQVAAIVHLVASSVPNLETNRVTVVDNKGGLLSGQMDTRQMMLSSTQFEYTQQVEAHYKQRVEDILAPILGMDSVRAEVTADLDFTVTEQTSERYNPDLPALRSEQLNEQASRLSGTQGVPGALANQPPAAGTAPEVAGAAAQGEEGGTPLNTSKRTTRNYELDKTISHTRLSNSNLRRLSVAVVIDDRISADTEGNISRTERTPEEISRISQLVKEAIGFKGTRGDTLQVINAPFLAPPEPEALPELEIWKEAWVLNLAKQVGGALLVLILIMFVLKPTMTRLTTMPTAEEIATAEMAAQASAAAAEGGGIEGGPGAIKLPGPNQYEDTLMSARGMVSNDPKRVAQVVKNWVAEDAGQ